MFLTVGLPGTGKTTAARRIEREQNALRLTKDEWMKALYGGANPAAETDVIEGRLIDIGLRALESGTNVVLDFGLWSRDERTALRQAAAEVGADVTLLYLELPAAEQWARITRRWADAPELTWPMSESELADYAAVMEIPTAGELDGTEPIDDPPAGFTSWPDWIAHRWPRTIAEADARRPGRGDRI